MRWLHELPVVWIAVVVVAAIGLLVAVAYLITVRLPGAPRAPARGAPTPGAARGPRARHGAELRLAGAPAADRDRPRAHRRVPGGRCLGRFGQGEGRGELGGQRTALRRVAERPASGR